MGGNGDSNPCVAWEGNPAEFSVLLPGGPLWARKTKEKLRIIQQKIKVSPGILHRDLRIRHLHPRKIMFFLYLSLVLSSVMKKDTSRKICTTTVVELKSGNIGFFLNACLDLDFVQPKVETQSTSKL